MSTKLEVKISGLPFTSYVTFYLRYYCCLFPISTSFIWLFSISFMSYHAYAFFYLLYIGSIFIENVLASLSIIISSVAFLYLFLLTVFPPWVLGHISLLLWMLINFLLGGWQWILCCWVQIFFQAFKYLFQAFKYIFLGGEMQLSYLETNWSFWLTFSIY